MQMPNVSILIPIRNEAAYIERCLKAVIGQDYPGEKMEILIADGMSSDGTREKLLLSLIQYPQIKLIDNPEKIVSTGLNRLILQAKGEVLIRVDGHCKIAPDYVSRCVAHIIEQQVDGVGGPMHSIGENWISQAIALAMGSKFGVGGSSFRTEVGQTKLADTVPFPAYTRDIIKQVGLYDEELVRNQDDEYNYRLRKHGGKLLLTADVRSTYYTRGSLKSLWWQFFQYGYWKVRVLQKHTRQMRPRQFIPPLFVLALCTGLLGGLIFPWGWRFLLGFVLLYLVAVLLISLLIAVREKWRCMLILPLAFITIHVGYGTGFWVGLFRFWRRWQDKLGHVPKVSLD